jgi:hypothetical protein
VLYAGLEKELDIGIHLDCCFFVVALTRMITIGPMLVAPMLVAPMVVVPIVVALVFITAFALWFLLGHDASPTAASCCVAESFATI